MFQLGTENVWEIDVGRSRDDLQIPACLCIDSILWILYIYIN